MSWGMSNDVSDLIDKTSWQTRERDNFDLCGTKLLAIWSELENMLVTYALTLCLMHSANSILLHRCYSSSRPPVTPQAAPPSIMLRESYQRHARPQVWMPDRS